MGLELNLLSFIPILIMGGGGVAAERGLKYFLIQACGSFRVLFFGVVAEVFSLRFTRVLILSLVLKGGGGPLHGWLPIVVGGLR